MKVRMLAVFSILTLAAWLPLEAQQAAAPAQPSPARAAANDSTKTAKPDHCSTTKCGIDASGKGCCHAKATAEGKCCSEGKDAKQTSCCSRKTEDAHSVANCCQGKKDGQSAAKDCKSCSEKMNTVNQKGCCAGIDECPIDTTGK